MGQPQVIVVGGGLAGCEAAWQAARYGVAVTLYEMRPTVPTPAHRTANLAELVCSNSLGSDLLDRAAGLLKHELRLQGSLLIQAADATAVPAGTALAVDREAFSEWVTAALEREPLIRVVREEVRSLPEGVTIIASGPLTSDALAEALSRLTGEEHLFFYDAMAPIVAAESIDLTIAFRQSRYRAREEPEGGDYLNCPLDAEAFQRFVTALVDAEQVPLPDFERQGPRYFEGCLPIEVLARRGARALLFGPMRPVGLRDPRTGRRPYAVVQLRQDNAAASLYNMVGFQTNLRWSEQARVFRLIPGLEHAEFVRYGQMHRNTYVNSPAILSRTLALRDRPTVFLAGQLAGVEGYAGNIATGLVAGVNAARVARGEPPLVWPETTMTGALCRYLCEADVTSFQPMKANFGLLPPLTPVPRRPAEHHLQLARRALSDLETFLSQAGHPGPSGR